MDGWTRRASLAWGLFALLLVACGAPSSTSPSQGDVDATGPVSVDGAPVDGAPVDLNTDAPGPEAWDDAYDGAPDGASDVGPDRSPESGPDVEPDAALDVEPDAALDVEPDAALDVEPDAALDVESATPCETHEDCAALLPAGSPCQIVVCDSALGTCDVGPDKDHTPCDDGDACTVDDSCLAGACAPGVALVCDDGDVCTDDSCEATTGCAHAPSQAPCDDGNGCTASDTCEGGTCQGEPTGSCECEADADCAQHEDDDLCNGTLSCAGGTCAPDPGSVIVCDTSGDGPCVTTACAPETGACEPALLDAVPCSDGDPCTQSDACVDGTCVGDAVPCTCADDVDCAVFQDGDACNGALHCVDGECLVDADTVVQCPEGEEGPCQVAACDPADGTCTSTDAPDGTPCDDDDGCTHDDACWQGGCAGVGLDCGDGDPCTGDACGGNEACANEPYPGCDLDGDCCEVAEHGGCGLLEVAVCVCTQEPACCESQWDAACVELATSSCGVDCGCPAGELEGCAGDCVPEAWFGDGVCHPALRCDELDWDGGDCCCEALAGTGCGDVACEAAVCDADPACCETQWDETCANAATLVCACGEAVPGSCCEADETVGCDSDPDCEAVVCAADAYCCEGPWDELCADTALAACDCGSASSPDSCCEPHTGPGCNDATCQELICTQDPFCCDAEWDQLCVDQAAEAAPCGDVWCEGPFVGDCCAAQPWAGCGDDPSCESMICAADALCCDTEWDEVCAAAALGACACGALPSCCGPGPGPGCGADPDCEATICDTDPFCCETEWDSICANEAKGECACGGFQDPDSCCEPGWGPGCGVELACEAAVCSELASCCDVAWDLACAAAAIGLCDCGLVGDTPECCAPHPGVGCWDPTCTELICGADPFCCETEWDWLCADAAVEQCEDCGAGGAPGSCCEANATPGCDVASCMELVCAQDPFCCDSQWDQLCVDQAVEAAPCGDVWCEPAPTEDCCEAQPWSGCAHDLFCEAVVCPADPLCCDSQWDQTCAEAASEACACGEGAALGGCCEPNGTPGCEVASCMELVCPVDPSCCDTAWDASCVLLAVDAAPCGDVYCPDFGTGACCEALAGPGCGDDLFCEATVCATDPLCCDSAWDQLCADAASVACACGEAAALGSCCEANGTPGCNDASCMGLVCVFDYFCCETEWDDICAEQAVQAAPCGDTSCELSGTGNCCEPQPIAGCDADPDCEALICADDPFCCDTNWDDICAAAALEVCACGAAPP